MSLRAAGDFGHWWARAAGAVVPAKGIRPDVLGRDDGSPGTKTPDQHVGISARRIPPDPPVERKILPVTASPVILDRELCGAR